MLLHIARYPSQTSPDSEMTEAEATRELPIDRLKGWLPCHLSLGSELPKVTWFNAGVSHFTEPFFHQSVKRVTAKAIDSPVTTGIDELLLLSRKVETLKPSGFIYHVSRCGSTLVANALKSLNHSVVISEAQPIDAAAWLYFANKQGENSGQLLKAALLKAVVNVLGQKRLGDERRLFIKFGNWQILLLDQIRMIWPDVPWIFLFRDPVEVIVSNLKVPCEWSDKARFPMQAAVLADCDTEELEAMSGEDYCARVLGRKMDAAVRFESAQSLFLDYKDLSVDRLVGIARFFGIEPSDEEIVRMSAAASVYSKDPSAKLVFDSDSGAKQRFATWAVRNAADRWSSEPYIRSREIASRHLVTRA